MHMYISKTYYIATTLPDAEYKFYTMAEPHYSSAPSAILIQFNLKPMSPAVMTS